MFIFGFALVCVAACARHDSAGETGGAQAATTKNPCDDLAAFISTCKSPNGATLDGASAMILAHENVGPELKEQVEAQCSTALVQLKADPGCK
jgi:hypothetical protein